MAKQRVGFKESYSSYLTLIETIGRGEYAPIYLLMGEESLFIDRVANTLAERVLTPEQQSFNQTIIYGRDSEAGVVINLARQVPMMGGRSVVIIREAQHLKGIDKLSIYAQKPNPEAVVVICHKEKSIDKRSALYKAVLKSGVVLESVRPRDYEVGGWLTGFLSAKGLKLSPKALSMLTDNLGSDITKIESEIDKLLLALPEGSSEINDSHIEEHIGISKEFNNFELVGAVVRRDVQRAFRIADHFARNPKDHPLLLSVLMLYREFRRMFTYNYMVWQSRKRGEPMPNDRDLMSRLAINNPYAVSELKQMCAQWNNRQLFGILALMREYDAKSKGIATGGESGGELLRELLLKIFVAS
ncbi:MAG: DNA polymerase III subunit delta [Rikenellaceae bacterium]